MPVDTAYARLVDANPVPDVDMLRTRVEADALLLDVTEGRHVMQSEMKPIQERDRSWPANRLPALAAGVAVVIAIAVVVLISRPSEVATTLGPIAAGEAYIAALDAHDADAIRALLAPDVVFENGLADSVEDVAGIMSFYAAADWRYTSDGCAQSTIDGTMVSLRVQPPERLDGAATTVRLVGVRGRERSDRSSHHQRHKLSGVGHVFHVGAGEPRG